MMRGWRTRVAWQGGKYRRLAQQAYCGGSAGRMKPRSRKGAVRCNPLFFPDTYQWQVGHRGNRLVTFLLFIQRTPWHSTMAAAINPIHSTASRIMSIFRTMPLPTFPLAALRIRARTSWRLSPCHLITFSSYSNRNPAGHVGATERRVDAFRRTSHLHGVA